MTIEELNKLIKEELDAFLNEEQTNETYMEDGDDDIKVTTDEPAEDEGGEALDTLRQIFNMLKPLVEPEEEEEEKEEEEIADGEDDEESLDEGVNESLYVTPDELQFSLDLARDLGFTDVKSMQMALAAATGPVFMAIVVLAQMAHAGVSAAIPKLKAALKGLKANPASRDVSSAVGLDEEEGAMTADDLADFVNKRIAKFNNVKEAVGYPNYRADQVRKVKADATDVNQGLNESVEKTTTEASNDLTDRFQKLANIQK